MKGGSIDKDKRKQLIVSAERLAIELALADVPWRDVWKQLARGFARAGVELDVDERLGLYEAWSAAFAWEEVA